MGTKPEKCMACLQALFLYQLMVMGSDQLSSQRTLEVEDRTQTSTHWDVSFEPIHIN